MKTFFSGTELRELRENLGLSLARLSELSGVSKASIGNYETDARGISKKAQLALRSAIDAFADDATARPASKELPNKPVPRPPSAGDAALLRRLYDLADAAEAPHKAANAAKDTAAMAVPGLLLNFAALVRVIDADTATLGLLGSLLYMVRIGITSDRKHLDFAKALLDRLAGEKG